MNTQFVPFLAGSDEASRLVVLEQTEGLYTREHAVLRSLGPDASPSNLCYYNRGHMPPWGRYIASTRFSRYVSPTGKSLVTNKIRNWLGVRQCDTRSRISLSGLVAFLLDPREGRGATRGRRISCGSVEMAEGIVAGSRVLHMNERSLGSAGYLVVASTPGEKVVTSCNMR